MIMIVWHLLTAEVDQYLRGHTISIFAGATRIFFYMHVIREYTQFRQFLVVEDTVEPRSCPAVITNRELFVRATWYVIVS